MRSIVLVRCVSSNSETYIKFNITNVLTKLQNDVDNPHVYCWENKTNPSLKCQVKSNKVNILFYVNTYNKVIIVQSINTKLERNISYRVYFPSKTTILLQTLVLHLTVNWTNKVFYFHNGFSSTSKFTHVYFTPLFITALTVPGSLFGKIMNETFFVIFVKEKNNAASLVRGAIKSHP